MKENNIIKNENIYQNLKKYMVDVDNKIVTCIIYSRSGRHTPIYAKIIGVVDDIIIVRTLNLYNDGISKKIHFHNMIGIAKIIKYKNVETLAIIEYI